jgi:hypothetical protein
MTQLLELLSADAPALSRREPAPPVPKHKPLDAALLQRVRNLLKVV